MSQHQGVMCALLLGICVLSCVGCSGEEEEVSPSPSPAQTVTWYEDVLPVAQKHCMGCHVKDGVAPFAMDSYETVAKWSASMASDVKARIMPPAQPAPDCNAFSNIQAMTGEEIDVFVRWDAAGAPAGDPANASGTPAPLPELETIDATLDIGADYTPQYNDEYRCFLLNPFLTQDTFATGVEVLPGADHEVHHVIVYGIEDSTIAQEKDEADPAPGWECTMLPNTMSVIPLAGWAPGTGAILTPPDTGLLLPVRQSIILQVHYNYGTGTPTPDRTAVNLQYAHKPVSVALSSGEVAITDFEIPANTMGYTYSKQFEVSHDGTMYGLVVHMHTRGREIKLTRTDGTGAETCLLDNPHWDFNWQRMYFYESPVNLKAGDTLTLTCVWDNDTDQALVSGEATSDEMCLYFSLREVPY